jgi:uncharacterized protein
MSSESLHVPREMLTQERRLLHYAITSLKEELDAIDWCRQRADDSEDESLKQLLPHNRREEMEHAAMLIEWLRRHNADFAGHLQTYLFTEGTIVGIERSVKGANRWRRPRALPPPRAAAWRATASRSVR